MSFSFDVFFDLSSGVTSSWNNMIGSGISVDCGNNFTAIVKGAAIFTDAANAATAGYGPIFARTSGVLGVASVLIKAFDKDAPPLGWGDIKFCCIFI